MERTIPKNPTTLYNRISFNLGAESGIHERRLLTDLLDNSGYNKLERPVINESEAVVLSFGLTLQQIIDVVRFILQIRNCK